MNPGLPNTLSNPRHLVVFPYKPVPGHMTRHEDVLKGTDDACDIQLFMGIAEPHQGFQRSFSGGSFSVGGQRKASLRPQLGTHSCSGPGAFWKILLNWFNRFNFIQPVRIHWLQILPLIEPQQFMDQLESVPRHCSSEYGCLDSFLGWSVDFQSRPS